MMSDNNPETHFGFQSVAWEDKEKKVTAVFDSVASRYDVMNDLMSLGVHRLWKRISAEICRVRKGQKVLDLAGGSGDLTRLLYKNVGPTGEMILADINASMLAIGRNRLLDEGHIGVKYVQANAEKLPFPENHFHLITIAFGLRNVTDKMAALQSMYQVCKPGGKLMILEFSMPSSKVLKNVYDWYSFQILPKLGLWVAKDPMSYQYLAESIRMHPNQEELKNMMEKAQFEDCHYFNLTGGIVALHIGYKY